LRGLAIGLCPSLRNRLVKKMSRQLRKQAKLAERSAERTVDPETRRDMLNLAQAYKAQAEVLKAKAKKNKRKD
jgi:hypothetical protein